MKATADIEDVTASNVQAIANLEQAAAASRPLGERLADNLVRTIGTWTFVFAQTALLLGWIVVNNIYPANGWDPYPFILLNLVLSFQAAFTTPMILMSENRKSRLAERRHHLDLQINLLAEQENTLQLKLLRLLCERAGITTSAREATLEERVNPTTILHQIEEQLEHEQGDGTKPDEEKRL